MPGTTDTKKAKIPLGSFIMNYGSSKIYPELEPLAGMFSADKNDMSKSQNVILTNGEIYFPPDAVEAIGVERLEYMNNESKESGHSAIDNIINMATLSNMKMMYGGGMVKPNYAGGGMVQQYGHGGKVDKMMGYKHGGKVNQGLKPVPKSNPGLGKLPEMVRNRMGYMQEGGAVTLPQYADAVKRVAGALGGSFDEDMYTEEGGVSRLNLANKLGVDPESMTVDTLSYKNPGSFVFDVSGVSPDGKELSVQQSMRGGLLPIEMMLAGAEKQHANKAKGDSAEAYRLRSEREPLLNILKNIRANVQFQNGGMVKNNLMGMMGGGMVNKKNKMMGYQDGGTVGPPVPPEMMGQAINQRLSDSIDMRMANPEMYQGSSVGSVRQQIEALKESIKQSTANKAKSSLALLKILGSGVPLDSVLNSPMPVNNMADSTRMRDLEQFLKMQQMQRAPQ